MKTRIFLIVSFVFVSSVGAFGSDRAQDLSAARDLYASARYDEALAVLNTMRPVEGTPATERKSIEQYRSLCLLALGRGLEAEAAIAAVVAADPMFQPGEVDASPRVRAAFSDVRQRMLPEIAASKYAAAKVQFDRREFVAAERQFTMLVALLNDPQMGGRLSDLRVLADGFLGLSTAAAAPPPEPKPAPVEKKEPRPPAPVVPKAPRIYNGEDSGVTAPVSIKQELPRVPQSIITQTRDRGLLELLIDEQGRVASITLRTPIHSLYDPLLMAAARDWRYKPATVDGSPVKFLKLIQVSVDKR